MLSLYHCIVLSAVLFATGAYGVLVRRNLLVVLMSIEIMLNAANLALVAFARHFGARGLPIGAPASVGAAHLPDGGHVFALMSMAVAACEVAVGLALVIAFFRKQKSILAQDMAELRG